MKLVIVESPAKSKTLSKYLGKDYNVVASFGHIRALPSKVGSVSPQDDFAMKYTIIDKSNKHVGEILKAVTKAKEIYLAPDPDREGESIAWHVAQVINESSKSKAPIKRITFNEITKSAVIHAVQNPRDIDIDLVQSQQSRQALDYLVGFTISPLLWRKLPGCRSAGRVQSVALRLICEKEVEIENFKSQEYWDIKLDMTTPRKDKFTSTVTHVDGVKLKKFSITNQDQAKSLEKRLEKEEFSIHTIEKKQQKRQPVAPFITSSLQQEASRKLAFSAKRTMATAQKLYEGIDIDNEAVGLITYMRTDGVTLAKEAVSSIRNMIVKKFGKEYCPTKPRIYKSKAKNAQEAHEAIRPVNVDLTPEYVKNVLTRDQYALYTLIWQRAIASQMENALIDLVVVDIHSKDFIARATGSTIAFDGFYRIYKEGIDDVKDDEKNLLPQFNLKEKVDLNNIKPGQHFTEPPPRYSEASLVKKLEELGIGRPSTYASILSVLQDRKYVKLEKKRFHPSDTGRLLNIFLTVFFKKYVEYDFTANLEKRLDDVAYGDLDWKELLRIFWQDFDQNVKDVSQYNIAQVIERVENELSHFLFGQDVESGRKCKECSDGILSLKMSKFGSFLACSNYPICTFKKSIIGSANDAQADIEFQTRSVGLDPETNKEIYLKKGPYGLYLQLGDLTDESKDEDESNKKSTSKDSVKSIAKNKSKTQSSAKTKTVKSKSKQSKPKRISLPAFISQDNLDFKTAVKLIRLPSLIGKHKDKSDMILNIGRFGPYLKYKDKFIAVPKKFNPLNLSRAQAIEIIDNKMLKDQKKALLDNQ